MLNKIRAALAVITVLLSGGCMLLPSESFYVVGAAKVGDAIFLYAPMCEGERLVGIEVTTEKENPANYDEPFITEHWVVEGPLESQVENGWIELGADADFAEVEVEGRHVLDWPEVFFVKLHQRGKDGEFISTAPVSADLPIPEYSAGEDLATAEYGIHSLGSGVEGQLMTPEEIRNEMGCAIQYF